MVVRFRDDKNFRKPNEDSVRMNGRINAREIRLIGVEGEQLGVMYTREALRMAEDLELDLVEISPTANPPVCKIMDYSKFCYEKTKKEKLNKKNSKVVQMKEISIRPTIEENDLQTKLKNAKRFLEKGDKVKITLKMRGREVQHSSDNVEVLKKFVSELADVSKVEQNIKQERFSATVILTTNVVAK